MRAYVPVADVAPSDTVTRPGVTAPAQHGRPTHQSHWIDGLAPSVAPNLCVYNRSQMR